MKTGHPQPQEITPIIDLILEHHYFNTKLQQLLEHKLTNPNTNRHYNMNNNGEVQGLLDDQYYKAEEEVVNELGDIIADTTGMQVRMVLEREFVQVGDEIQGIKRDMFVFMDEQAKRMDEMKKQMHRLAEEVKRKATTTQAMSNTAVINPNGYTGGIRFLRSSVGSSQNVVGSSSNASEGKSFHSQLSALRKQIEELKESLQKGESVRVIQQQFNQFKIQTKVALEALKQHTKKQSVQLNTLTKATNSPQIPPSLLATIQSTTKRTISAQLKAYATYADQITSIRAEVEKLQDGLAKQGELHNEYLSNQLKSVWLVLNDMKRNLDQVTESVGLNSSREIL